MPPHGSAAHEHDDDDEDIPGVSLRSYFDLDGVSCGNEVVMGSGRNVLKPHEDRLSESPYVRSPEDDPELLLHIPFTEAVSAKSIAIRSIRTGNVNDNDDDDDIQWASPRTVQLFANREGMDFEAARETTPAATFTLLPPDHFPEGTIDYPLRPAGKFANMTSLTVFFPDNFADDGQVATLMTYVGLKGKGTGHKKVAVEAVYETRGMKKDHQVSNGEKFSALMGP